MADEDLTGPRKCEKSGEFKAGGVFFRDFNLITYTYRDPNSFYIHGPKKKGRFGDSSAGCPICDLQSRCKIVNEWGGILNVVD